MSDALQNGIAIVGMAGRFPACRSIEDYWRLLKEGREATLWLTDEELIAAGESLEAISAENYVKATLPLPDMEFFDAGFFGFSQREADILDPQHRQLLECCWEALEDAAHMPERFDGEIGVFAGCGPQYYFANNLLTNAELVRQFGVFYLRHMGNDKDMLTTRVSYLLNLKGPSVAVQTACSTSLVAVHMAAQSLLSGECDMALAGGTAMEWPYGRGYRHHEGEILSSDGHCRAFDDNSDGTVLGSGAGVVVLRRLADALADNDHIYAVIRGSAINNDGASKAGYLAPSVEGQARAAIEALTLSEVPSESVAYIEAHGTGTRVGDPIELTALNEVYGNAKAGAIKIGSVKSNIGHLDTAAGVAGLIKATLALKREHIPASLNCARPNTRFDFASSPFKVATRGENWPRVTTPRRAAVNSLGVGGTNAHVILEEAPLRKGSGKSEAPHILTLSAKTPESARALAGKWRGFLASAPEDFSLADAAFTLQAGRTQFGYRVPVAGRNREEVLACLDAEPMEARAAAPRIGFMFSGGGAQFPGACRDLYEGEATFKAAVDGCFAALPPGAPANLRTFMFERDFRDKEAAASLAQATSSLLAVFIIEYALGLLWRERGITPGVVIGHSAGEYAAAALTGVMSLKDALSTVMKRGELFARTKAGTMTTLRVDEKTAREMAGPGLDIAVINHQNVITVSGPESEIDALEARTAAAGVESTRIRINVAAHSRLLDDVLEDFRAHLKTIKLHPPKVQWVSNLTGNLANPADVASVEYWVRHLRETVRFGDGLCAILRDADVVLVEVGPGRALCALAEIAEGAQLPAAIIASSRAPNAKENDRTVFARACASLWAIGAAINLAPLRAPGVRIPLPTYAFARERHWIDAGAALTSPEAPVAKELTLQRMPLDQWLQRRVWKPAPRRAAGAVETRTWLVFANDGLAGAFAAEAAQRGVACVIVTPGEFFAQAAENAFVVNPFEPESYARLIGALRELGAGAWGVVHDWTHLASAEAPWAAFDSLFLLVQAMQLEEWTAGVRILAIGRDGDKAAAALLGPSLVAPHESIGLAASFLEFSSMRDADLAREIFAEADANTRDAHVRFTQGVRQVHEVQSVPRDAPKISRRLRHRGTYLITGGMSGIGLALAEYLAKEVEANLVLVGRSAPPARIGWEDAASSPANLPAFAQAKTLLDIERHAAGLLLLQANVTDTASMAAAIAEARGQFGAINGVFHAAGYVNDALIAMKSLDDAHEVLSAKARGVLVLDAAFADGELDVFAGFSSTSLLIGAPGQADYVAANAVLDAVLAARSDGLSIAWGPWRDIGIAARMSKPAIGEALVHPLLGAKVAAPFPGLRFEARYSPDAMWALNEHVVQGSAVLPGTGYVEITYAVARALGFGDAAALRNLSFQAPLTCAWKQTQFVRIDAVALPGDVYRVSVESRGMVGEGWLRHFEVEISRGAAPGKRAGRPPSDGAPISFERLEMADRGVAFGPRWRNLVKGNAGDARATAIVELPTAFESDLKTFRFHPAMLDTGAAVGLFVLDDVGEGPVYAPIAIDDMAIYAPLPRRFVTSAVLVERGNGQAVFDVDLVTQLGRPIAKITRMTFQLLDPATFQTERAILQDSAASPLERVIANGIRQAEAPRIFAQALTCSDNMLLASAVPLRQARAVALAGAARPAAAPAEGSAAAITFANETEAAIGAMCADVLGLPAMGPDEEFLAAGGGSLMGVRLFARMRRELGVNLPLSTLLEAPSVRLIARIVRAELGLADEQAKPRDGSEARGWSPLVRIRKGDPARTPLFCIHGAGGNVVVFKELANRLAKDMPIYGLQARGIDGLQPFHETIEDMADCYLEAIRTAWPSGPYRFAGYSGGGVVAYEMAQRLRAEGQSVEFVAMFDTMAPDHLRLERMGMMQKLKLASQLKPNYVVHWLERKIRDEQRRRRIQAAATGEQTVDLEVVGERMWHAFATAASRYFPAPYEGDVVLFRARNVPTDYLRLGRSMGWDRLVNGDLKVMDVEAWHDTIFAPPAIDAIAREITRRCAQQERELVR